MKKYVSCLFLILFSFGFLAAQNISMNEDSLKFLLCDRRWQAEYAMIDDLKIGKMPSVTDITYEFKSDKTYFIGTSDQNKLVKGKWNYDTTGKAIILTVNNKVISTVISINSDKW